MTDRMNEWQPLETAPRDGTKIDLWHPTNGRFVNAFWCKQTYTLHEPWGWSSQQLGRITGVTHWMPLPRPPHD